MNRSLLILVVSMIGAAQYASALDPVVKMESVVPPFGAELDMDEFDFSSGRQNYRGKEYYVLKERTGQLLLKSLELEVDLAKAFSAAESAIPFRITEISRRTPRLVRVEIELLTKAGKFIGRATMIPEGMVLTGDGNVYFVGCALLIEGYYFCNPNEAPATECRRLEWVRNE